MGRPRAAVSRNLYDEIEKKGLPLLSQAEGYRARVAQRELRAEAEKANARMAETVQKEVPRVLEEQAVARPFLEPLLKSAPADRTASSQLIEVDHRGPNGSSR